jgi:hypothetical protein
MKNNNQELSIKVDKERMKQALSSKSIMVPQGLTKEEKRQFILDFAKK